jgi:uncharacterized protein YecE (DUF72 family)
VNHPSILLGTSSFTATGWQGSFYPKGMRPADYLRFYAERFHTVEVDSTFYACPTARTVENWNARTPEAFIFSVKVPQTIRHDRVLVDCDGEVAEFLETMDILGEKLGPIIFQFPFFSRSIFPDRHAFTDRLIPFPKKLPKDHKFGVEIRNRDWLNAEFANILRDHQIALVLQDHKNAAVTTLSDTKRTALLAQLQKLNALAPQPRGYAFEEFLKDLFSLSNLAPRNAFRLVGEQIVASNLREASPGRSLSRMRNRPSAPPLCSQRRVARRRSNFPDKRAGFAALAATIHSYSFQSSG